MSGVIPSRRAALTGSLSAIAAGMVSPAIAAVSASPDPVLDLYRQFDALETSVNGLYQRASSRSAILTAKHKGKPTPAGASQFFWYDFDDPELRSLIDQIDALGEKQGRLAEKMQEATATTKEGAAAKLRVALIYCPRIDPDLDFHVTAAIDAMQDALQVLEART